MRLTLAAAMLILVLPGGVRAQDAVPRNPSTLFGPLPAIGFPLPPIGFPLPHIGLPPPTGTQPRTGGDSFGRHGKPDQHRRSGRRGSNGAIIYIIPAYGWGYPLAGAPAGAAPGVHPESPKTPAPVPETGTLRFDVEPSDMLQFYVDGYYVASSADFDGALELEAGRHTIEIRATGYEPLVFDVSIAAHRTITYRDTLKRAAAASTPERSAPAPAPVETPPPAPSTFYLIPGCYLGNVPPADAGLPPTCDQSRVTTFKQQ
jgi:hypothetical protein